MTCTPGIAATIPTMLRMVTRNAETRVSGLVAPEASTCATAGLPSRIPRIEAAKYPNTAPKTMNAIAHERIGVELSRSASRHGDRTAPRRSEEHTSELQSRGQ